MPKTNKVLGTVKDAMGRPLLILMRTKKGTLMHVFKRYKDMTAEDKARVMGMHARVTEGVVVSEKEMRDFLDFKDDLPCG